MVESEREMLRKLDDTQATERFTSLQPTYEDSVAPHQDDWEVERDYS